MNKNKEDIKFKIRQAIEENPFKIDIEKASLFGSYVNGVPREDSDVDLLIEFAPEAKIGFFSLVGIKEDMERVIGKSVDLLTSEAVSEYFREEILRQAEVVYER